MQVENGDKVDDVEERKESATQLEDSNTEHSKEGEIVMGDIIEQSSGLENEETVNSSASTEENDEEGHDNEEGNDNEEGHEVKESDV